GDEQNPCRGTRRDRVLEQPRPTRWRNLAGVGALVIGATVVGVAFNRQPRAPAATQGNSGASLVDIVTPSAGTTADEAIPFSSRAFPKKIVQTPNVQEETTGTVEAVEEVAPLSFQALNFYHIRDGKPAQDYPWLQDVKLIEPHRETTLSVSSPRDGYDYIWEVRSGDTDDTEVRASTRGAEALITLTILDDNVITLKEVNSDGEIMRQLDELVMVKYVRREIRTLTDDEREELFDAMFTLWDVRVDTGKGKELYGDDYADIYAINRLHFKAAMSETCDHFHDGLGFLTSHSLISNTFEYSLQRVNPKLTLPYWDFTIEDFEAEKSFDDDDLKIVSPIFQESWFGSADPDDNIVR
ncbi:unnamed protein product, partial [Ectocarpus sp. 8 AP-2014]